jgi:hypothetical protein
VFEIGATYVTLELNSNSLGYLLAVDEENDFAGSLHNCAFSFFLSLYYWTRRQSFRLQQEAGW